MPAGGAFLSVAGPIVATSFLIGSALWARARYRTFERLPVHFNWSGQATQLAPRDYVLGIITAVFFASLVLVVVSVVVIPQAQLTGDPGMAVIVSSVAVIAAQAFVLWLIDRWAKNNA